MLPRELGAAERTMLRGVAHLAAKQLDKDRTIAAAKKVVPARVAEAACCFKHSLSRLGALQAVAVLEQSFNSLEEPTMILRSTDAGLEIVQCTAAFSMATGVPAHTRLPALKRISICGLP